MSHNCHITLCASRRKEIFNIKGNTKGNTMLCSQWCVGEDKNLFLLSQVASIPAIFVLTCVKDWTTFSPSSTLLLQGWLSKKGVLLKQWSGEMYPLIGCLNCHVPITWLIWGHFWSTTSINFSQNFHSIPIANTVPYKQKLNLSACLILSNNIKLFSQFKVCREEKLYLRCFSCSLVPGLTARERTTYWNLREVCCWC